MATNPNPIPHELLAFSSLLEGDPLGFARGSNDARQLALTATKFVFDSSLISESTSFLHITKLFASLSPFAAPSTRSQTHKKRKRSPSPPPPITLKPTPLQSLVVNGMDEDQLWAQLDLKLQGVCRMLNLVVEADNDVGIENETDTQKHSLLMGDDSLDAMAAEDIEEYSEDSDDYSEEDRSSGSEGSPRGEESVTDLRDSSDEEIGGDSEDSQRDLDGETRLHSAVSRKPSSTFGLNDDFFDLALFNAETGQAEAKNSSRGHLADEDESDDDDIDLFAPVDLAHAGELDQPENGIYYNDFFRTPQPARLQSNTQAESAGTAKNGRVRFHEEVRVKKIRQRGKGLSLRALQSEDNDELNDVKVHGANGNPGWSALQKNIDGSGSEDEDVVDSETEGRMNGSSNEDRDEGEDAQSTQRDIARLKQDLFAEEEEAVQPDLSTHEKRMALLQKQIEELEDENVAPKDWVLMGEATSRTRPQNSLLAEDLEFDRVAKAVPVVTVEAVKALEDRIRARILEGQFDDVVRLRPVDDKLFLPSRFVELKETKSTQSLAQVYEEDYLAQRDGSKPGGARDEKLQKEHTEIENLWESICSKLDALCNAHFTPKQPKATISTISNASTTILESALPTTKSAVSMLAPEEVFAPSSSELRSRSEMTPQEKKSLRNKQRKARQKSRDQLQKSTDKFAKANKARSVKMQKEAALASVVRSGKGVTVMGKTSMRKQSGKS
ncbi:hypothetical protein AX16_009620 [Volvariella volvacea WC 439]|nr:hypothetical protein AX16_009620 [Volvariella volvacea WC 439]